MEPIDPDDVTRATALLLAAALATTVTWQMRNRSRVGAVRLRIRRRPRVRVAVLLASLACGAAVLAGSPATRELPTIAVIVLSVLLLFASPGFQDSAWGSEGVQRGWHARRFRELEAWRLIGEHLRWKLFGEWVASDVPSREHAALRVQLEAEAPGRESVHGNSGFDAQRIAAAKSNS